MDRQDINFIPTYIHPEEEPNIDELNKMFNEAQKDLVHIDNKIVESANNFYNLLKSTRLKLTDIKEQLIAERERQQDINILCNKYSDFDSVINLKEEDFLGTLQFENGILHSRITSTSEVEYEVESIDGNGFPGNRYVYLNDEFLNETVDTSLVSYIKDNNITTAYEYSRITTSNDSTMPALFNKDSIEAECSILLSSEVLFNHIQLSSERNDLILKEIYTSLDGLTYKLDKEYNLAINDRNEMYNDSKYIYGSGIITVEPCKFVKIVLRSNGYAEDQLAYIKTFYSDNANDNTIKKIEKDNTSKRHVIKINDIKLLKNSYSKGMITSRELITTPVKCISLYCNSYINDQYSIDKNVSFYLIINGNEHKVLPINSHTNGQKVIRTSSQIYESEHVIYLTEEIKSAKLKVVINTANSDITPYISDIKILVGGDM